jgi:hypothetical protein
MAASIKGVQPLKFGTTTTTGYVVDSYTGDETTQELVIEDEGGDIITQILGFGNKDEITVEVIPKTATSRPTMGVLLTIGGTALNVLGLLAQADEEGRREVDHQRHRVSWRDAGIMG